MLKYRLLTSLIGVPLVIYIVYLGGWAFFFSLLIIVAIATYEFYKIAKNKGIEFSIGLSLFLNIFIVTFVFRGYKINYIIPVLIFYIILSSTYKALIKNEINKILEKVSLEIFSSLYVAFPLSYFLLIRKLHYGSKFVTLLLAMAWLNDSFAYFIGKKWGKIKMNTHISPNKTREGAIGGLLGGVFSALIFGYFFHFDLKLVFPLSIIVIIFSQIGDLVESAFKREVGVKDAGTIIPGHGGVLDRFDGLIYATPTFYYLIILVFRNIGG